MNKEEAGGIEGILSSYNEMQLDEMASATKTLAFTIATYYRQLTEIGVDIDTARALCIVLQQGLLANIKPGGKP